MADHCSSNSHGLMKDYRRLVGKVAIITGGASGIGEATVKLFVEHGAKVVIADIQDDKGEELAKELGDAACYKHCDVRKEEQVEALVAEAVEKFGRLDVMFNNAGVVGRMKSEDVGSMDMDDFDQVMAVNVRGMALGVKHASRTMVATGTRGVILCTSSVASVMAGMSPVVYTVSKHAILGLVRAATSDLGKHGIRVNCVSPFGVPTPLVVDHLRHAAGNPSISAADAAALRDSIANLRGGTGLTVNDVAHAALFLASDDASYVSGLNMLLDGGFTTTSHGFDHHS